MNRWSEGPPISMPKSSKQVLRRREGPPSTLHIRSPMDISKAEALSDQSDPVFDPNASLKPSSRHVAGPAWTARLSSHMLSTYAMHHQKCTSVRAQNISPAIRNLHTLEAGSHLSGTCVLLRLHYLVDWAVSFQSAFEREMSASTLLTFPRSWPQLLQTADGDRQVGRVAGACFSRIWGTSSVNPSESRIVA
jgi:hypothetical protein